jgi:hypothetical protein
LRACSCLEYTVDQPCLEVAQEERGVGRDLLLHQVELLRRGPEEASLDALAACGSGAKEYEAAVGLLV